MCHQSFFRDAGPRGAAGWCVSNIIQWGKGGEHGKNSSADDHITGCLFSLVTACKRTCCAANERLQGLLKLPRTQAEPLQNTIKTIYRPLQSETRVRYFRMLISTAKCLEAKWCSMLKHLTWQQSVLTVVQQDQCCRWWGRLLVQQHKCKTREKSRLKKKSAVRGGKKQS